MVKSAKEVELCQVGFFVSHSISAFKHFDGPFFSCPFAKCSVDFSIAPLSNNLLKIIELLDVLSSFPDKAGEIDIKFFEQFASI